MRDFTPDFEAAAAGRTEPDWGLGALLGPAVLRSLQRFQVGESGDGANLIAKASVAGPDHYAKAVRLFVAEEQDHARLLARLLLAGGSGPIAGHWTDTVFVRLRRALGLRLELMVLLIAEVVALRYYRALRDGSRDPLTSAVAARILADEHRHVPFHCARLRDSFAELPVPARAAAYCGWWMLLAGVTLVVAADHGVALRVLEVSRTGFCLGVAGQFAAVIRRVRP
ncbi:ferritin-like domain-containing protein [Nonomuraea sediminis]|uniref:ferritin-like domain-containing protein n=1 Tax=Nonomuraea sediminis TaxID=2835864 RepID=UPI001BDD3D0E|nr:ferritin-like domain-containing protein [Nonomuraea sediminis]